MNEEELIEKTRELIRRWDNVRVTGLGWSGDPRRGFQFNPTDVRTGGGGSGGTPPPPTTSGACCPAEGDCFIATQTICETGGGTYQGDDTTCDPDPCPPKGACCVGTDCTIETETDCADIGGTYQGDDTVCDPNPCVLPPCNGCGFDAFDGSGRKFLTLHRYVEFSTTCAPFPNGCCGTPDPIISFLSAEDYSAFESYDVDCNYSINVVSNTHTFTSCTGVVTGPSCCADWDATTPFIGGWTVDSATEQHSTSAGTQETVVLHQVLSDECTPP